MCAIYICYNKFPRLKVAKKCYDDKNHIMESFAITIIKNVSKNCCTFEEILKAGANKETFCFFVKSMMPYNYAY